MITSLRASAACAVLTALALGLSGCAGGTRLAVAPAAPAASTGPLYATVAQVRPVPAPAGTEQPAILAAMGAGPAGDTGGAAGRSEILVRTDDGQTLSVVTTANPSLAPGARVVLLPGPSLRLGRPGITAPAS